MDRADRLALRVAMAGAPWTPLLVAAAIVEGVLGLAVPAVLGVVTDALLRGTGYSAALAWMASVLTALTLFEAASPYLEAKARTRSLHWSRTRFLRHVLGGGADGQRGHNAGDLVSRFTNNTLQVSASPMSVTLLITSLVTSLGGIIALFTIDLRLGLLFVAAVPVVWFLTAKFLTKVTETNTRYIAHHNAIAVRLLDAMRGMRTIRAGGTAERETERILAPVGDLKATALRLWAQQTKVGWQTSLLQPVLRIGVLAMSGYAVTAGDLSPGELLAASGYLSFALGVLQYLPMATEIGLIRGSARLLGEVLDTEPLPSGSRSLEPGPAAVSLMGVRVSARDRSLLADLDLEVPAGTTMALVGRSGVGKTTLTGVLGGVLRPDGGTVAIDGVPIAELRADVLRHSVAYAFERPHLLGTTIRDALAYGAEGIGEAELVAALEATSAAEFVAKLPERMDTGIEDLRLSGGEVQRLGLARAVCRGAKLVVFDDALSSVDTATEAAISRALTGHLPGATKILVAHRPATAARADLVAWLEDGRIRAVAPHTALLSEPGYRALFTADDGVRAPERGTRAR